MELNSSVVVKIRAVDSTTETKNTDILLIPVKDLHFDPLNPRLPTPIHNQGEQEILTWMIDKATVTELIGSIAANGYFPGEPLMAVERPEGGYFVIEGNRRLAAAKLLLNPQPSFTIVAHAHHVPLHPGGDPMVSVGVDQWALQGEFNRRLSWRECAAIQGLPETTIPNGSVNRKYKVIGNAVPPAFGRMLLTPVVEYESSL